MADDWQSPTGFNDPGSAWSNEANAYDDNTGTHATNDTKDNYLEVTLGAAINCDKVRIYCQYRNDRDWLVDVYYSGGWNNIHNGPLPIPAGYLEIAVGSTQEIDKARFKCPDRDTAWINDFDFNQVAAAGWTGELGGATIATGYEICGVSQANIAEIMGVA